MDYTGFTLNAGGRRGRFPTRPTRFRTTPRRATFCSAATDQARRHAHRELGDRQLHRRQRRTADRGVRLAVRRPGLLAAAGWGQLGASSAPSPERTVRLRRAPRRRGGGAFPGVVSSFTDAADGNLTLVGRSPVSNHGGASCWIEISHDALGFSSSTLARRPISSYSIGTGGTLSFVHSTRSGRPDRRRRRRRTALPRRLDALGGRVGTNAVTGFTVNGGTLTLLTDGTRPARSNPLGHRRHLNPQTRTR